MKKSRAVAPACPCGSGKHYAACCAPLHDGSRQAPTAQALMRSRFSAYALGRHDYLLDTWHPDTRPAALDGLDRCKWIRLVIDGYVGGGEGDAVGSVAFRAWYTLNGRAHLLAEHSRFERVAGRWRYRDGDLSGPEGPPSAPGRDADAG